MKIALSLAILMCGMFFHTCGFSQTNNLRHIDNSLTKAFKKANASRSERLEIAFGKNLLKKLKNSITFDKPLDSLSKLISIKTSSDKKIKFYSWELVDGSSHNITCVAQYKSKNRNIAVQQLSEEGGDNFNDCGIYEAHPIKTDKTSSYLTFGWGTHGGGL